MTDWTDYVRKNRPERLPPLTPERLDNAALAQAYFHYYGIDFENRYPELEHFFGAFDSGGYDIATHVFRQPSARGTAFLYHGYYDHVGLFNHAIEYCLGRGYSVVAYDLPGHGVSSGDRASIESFQLYVRVLRDALEAVEPFRLPAPSVALAQSTGAAVLMTHLLEGGEADFDKVVMLAPLVRPVGWQAGRYTHMLLSPFVRSVPRRWTVGSGDRAFVKWQRHEDPLQCRELPLRWVTSLKHWEAKFHWLPHCDRDILVVQGCADRTVDWQFNIPAVLEHFSNAQVFYLREAKHHLVKETEAIRHRIWLRVTEYLES